MEHRLFDFSLFLLQSSLNWICLANWRNRYEHLTFLSRTETHENRSIRLMNNFTRVI